MTKRSVWTAVLGLVLVGAAVGSVVTALVFPGVDRSPIRNSTRTVAVTAKVERRPVRTPLTLSATVRAPVVAALMPNASVAGQPTNAGQGASTGQEAASGREVVSGRVLKVGDTVRVGDLIAEVSGRPVLAMPADMPLYRDLGPGASGNDVAALQRMLSKRGHFTGAANGTFNAATLEALNRLFRGAKYETPMLLSGQRGLPLADTATLPVDGVRVTRAAAIGAVLGASIPVAGAGAGGDSRDGKAGVTGNAGNMGNAGQATTTQTLVEVEVSPAALTARIDMLQAQSIKAGDAVNVRVGSSESAASTVASVSGFQESAASQPSGYDIVVPLPAKLVSAAKPNEAATISEATSSIPKGPAVPLVSIHQDASSPYVVLASPKGAAADGKRVPVTVRGQAEGYAILEDNPELPDGATVIVSGAA